MALVNQPAILPVAFAAGGDKNTIPATNDGLSGLASLEKGFPPICQQPLASGGLPPQRADFNGIFNLVSLFLLYVQNGGVFAYNNGLDYQPPCLVADPDSNIIYQCLQQNGPNTSAGVQALTQTAYWQAIVLPTDSVVSDVTESNGTVTVDKADGSSSTFDVVTSVNGIETIAGNVDINRKFYNALSQLGLDYATVTFESIVNTMPANSTLTFYADVNSGTASYAPNLNVPTSLFIVVTKGSSTSISVNFDGISLVQLGTRYYGRYTSYNSYGFSGWQKVSTVVEEVSGLNGYRKYSDGRIEQWGVLNVGTLTSNTDITKTVNFSVPFTSNNYRCNLTIYGTTISFATIGMKWNPNTTSPTTSMNINLHSINYQAENVQINWTAEGYYA